MLQTLFSIFFTTLVTISGFAQPDSLVKRLDYAISHKKQFALVKEKRIAKLRASLSGSLSADEEYRVNEKLYGEYRKYRIDSAKFFVTRNLEIAEASKDIGLKQKAQIQLANLLSSSGNFLESKSILENIDAAKLDIGTRALYYEFFSQFYEHYATINPSKSYSRQIEVYRDSLLTVLDKTSNKYKINLAQHYIYTRELAKAKTLLSDLLQNSKQKDGDYIMFVYLLGDILQLEGDPKAIDYYYLAAIGDTENSIKDNAAIQNLAIHYFSSRKIDLANQYAQSALEDAVFCNVTFRTLAASEFYSIVNTAYQEKERHNKQQLKLYLLLISVLTVFLIVAVVYVYRQMRRTSAVKEKLAQSAKELELLNQEMLKANDELQESNRVKEEYIAQFFDICSSYINKLDEYRNKLIVKAVNKQFDDLARVLKSDAFTQNELQELYRNFDVVFLNLYPSYVEEFNALLVPEEQMVLKDGELMNMELRIFALERLGITDSVRIASFLRFSLSTIYNYRTKIRNKSVLSREDFEARIKTLGSGRE